MLREKGESTTIVNMLSDYLGKSATYDLSRDILNNMHNHTRPDSPIWQDGFPVSL